jgi:hypothetical protein
MTVIPHWKLTISRITGLYRGLLSSGGGDESYSKEPSRAVDAYDIAACTWQFLHAGSRRCCCGLHRSRRTLTDCEATANVSDIVLLIKLYIIESLFKCRKRPSVPDISTSAAPSLIFTYSPVSYKHFSTTSKAPSLQVHRHQADGPPSHEPHTPSTQRQTTHHRHPPASKAVNTFPPVPPASPHFLPKAPIIAHL